MLWVPCIHVLLPSRYWYYLPYISYIYPIYLVSHILWITHTIFPLSHKYHLDVCCVPPAHPCSLSLSHREWFVSPRLVVPDPVDLPLTWSVWCRSCHSLSLVTLPCIACSWFRSVRLPCCLSSSTCSLSCLYPIFLCTCLPEFVLYSGLLLQLYSALVLLFPNPFVRCCPYNPYRNLCLSVRLSVFVCWFVFLSLIEPWMHWCIFTYVLDIYIYTRVICWLCVAWY